MEFRVTNVVVYSTCYNFLPRTKGAVSNKMRPRGTYPQLYIGPYVHCICTLHVHCGHILASGTQKVNLDLSLALSGQVYNLESVNYKKNYTHLKAHACIFQLPVRPQRRSFNVRCSQHLRDVA